MPLRSSKKHVDHFQHAFKTPNKMPGMGGWPHHVEPDMKKAIIANRKYIIQDLKNVFSSKMDHQKFLKIRATDDITFEDPLERIDGIDNVGHFFSMFCTSQAHPSGLQTTSSENEDTDAPQRV